MNEHVYICTHTHASFCQAFMYVILIQIRSFYVTMWTDDYPTFSIQTDDFIKKKFFFHAAYSVKLMKHSQGPCGLGISKQQRVGESSHPGHFSGSVKFSSVQFNSVAQSCPTLCNPMDCITTGLPVHHQLLELAQTHAHQVGDAIQPSHPLLSLSSPGFNLPTIRVFSNEAVLLNRWPKYLEFQLQHQSFQWIFGVDFL